MRYLSSQQHVENKSSDVTVTAAVTQVITKWYQQFAGSVLFISSTSSSQEEHLADQ